MGVVKKQGVSWIDYYVSGHRKRECIGPTQKLAGTMPEDRKLEIAEGKPLAMERSITTIFEERADGDL